MSSESATVAECPRSHLYDNCDVPLVVSVAPCTGPGGPGGELGVGVIFREYPGHRDGRGLFGFSLQCSVHVVLDPAPLSTSFRSGT